MEENKVRYSDEELEEFRQLINEKLAVAKSDYEVLMQKINGDGVDEAETHSTYHTLEEGSETLSKESLMNEVMRAQKFITGLQHWFASRTRLTVSAVRLVNSFRRSAFVLCLTPPYPSKPSKLATRRNNDSQASTSTDLGCPCCGYCLH